MNFIIINGEIFKKQETGFLPFFWDEPFVITQKFWFGYGGIPLFQKNLKSLILKLNTLNADIPDLLKNEHEIFRVVKRMLNKNRFYRSGIITCQVFITQPETNIIISSFAFPEFDFPISKQGLIINFSEFEKYRGNPLNQFGFSNAPNWKFADARNMNTAFYNSIFVNERGHVCDCISANIFMIKGKTLYTPHTETGCFIDSIRSHIIKIAPLANLKGTESDNIKKEDV
ncbi:MAG TPA: aminotransferase class IV, partial [Draconibacterium sp.]|nr:aminotransferase class IV [Draconibacterium sp.]